MIFGHPIVTEWFVTENKQAEISFSILCSAITYYNVIVNPSTLIRTEYHNFLKFCCRHTYDRIRQFETVNLHSITTSNTIHIGNLSTLFSSLHRRVHRHHQRRQYSPALDLHAPAVREGFQHQALSHGRHSEVC